MFNKQQSREKILTYSVRQFPGCEYSPHCSLQAVNILLLNTDLGRDAEQPSVMQCFHYKDTVEANNLESIDNSTV